MRTIFNIELLDEIYQNPFEIIGQRNYYILQSFIMPYELTTDAECSLNHALEDVPSIRDFISKQLDVEVPGATKWTWAIAFDIEDQRELYEAYFNWIYKYEEKYPLSKDKYEFKLNANEVVTIDLLKIICQRPYLYGIQGLPELRALIDGLFHLKESYNIDLTENENKLLKFIDYWKTRINKAIKYNTWDRAFSRERLGINDFTFQDGNNGGWVFRRFIEILSEENGLIFKEPNMDDKEKTHNTR